MTALDYDTAVQKHLLPGEQLCWVGRARQGWRYRWNNRLVVVQAGAAVLCLIWLARMINWWATAAGANLGLPLGRPSLQSSVVVTLFGLVLWWQLRSEHRRRAGTWYAVTDRRILFVLTNVVPQSVIGVPFAEIAAISLNDYLKEVGPIRGVVIKLKGVDPYLCSSHVLGYQMSNNGIILEDLEDPRGFYDEVIAQKEKRAGEAVEPVLKVIEN